MRANRVFNLALVAALACAVGCSACGLFSKPGTGPVTVKSPDGRSEIRLYSAPLRVEALRDGVTLVAPTRIGLTVDGRSLGEGDRPKKLVDRSGDGRVETPIYKKASVDLTRRETYADFGDWGVALVARNDGVAYRFETAFDGEIVIGGERADLAIPDANARCWVNYCGAFGCEESVVATQRVCEIRTNPGESVKNWMGRRMVYLPLVYQIGDKTVAVTESDVRDYPVWNLTRDTDAADGTFDSLFAGWPKESFHATSSDWKSFDALPSGGRWVRVKEHADYLVKGAGTRTLPWRAFLLADAPAKLAESDIVYALAAPADPSADFSWVKPGKVAWDWWNCFDNRGDEGCNTKTYERFIDFAAKKGVEYVIFDEGWSAKLDIWKFHPAVDVPHLIDYANRRGVGIILWMAWAQVVGDEERVASYFSRLGAKGFKVDFMDRGDAEVMRFLEKFAAVCAKERMLVDYHGATRPVGLQRRYPNIVNYEGVHGLEQMKWFDGKYDFLANDVREVFGRMTAGPMDYTPGAMLNYRIGEYPTPCGNNPGSLGTRARQVAMMALFEAPLQMLCDSPTNYEKNRECFRFMAETPVVWDDTVAVGGTPDTYVALARKAKDGAWYVAGINNAEAREIDLDLSFLGEGTWRAECFRDGRECGIYPTSYVHVSFDLRAEESVWMAPGGGFVMRIVKK